MLCEALLLRTLLSLALLLCTLLGLALLIGTTLCSDEALLFCVAGVVGSWLIAILLLCVAALRCYTLLLLLSGTLATLG